MWSDSPDEANAFACQQWRNHGAFREPDGGFSIFPSPPSMLPPPAGSNKVSGTVSSYHVTLSGKPGNLKKQKAASAECAMLT